MTDRKEYEMTFEEWVSTVPRGVTITPEMAFAAGAASRDAEIAELVAAIESVIPEVAGGNTGLLAYNKCKAALAKVRKPE